MEGSFSWFFCTVGGWYINESGLFLIGWWMRPCLSGVFFSQRWINVIWGTLVEWVHHVLWRPATQLHPTGSTCSLKTQDVENTFDMPSNIKSWLPMVADLFINSMYDMAMFQMGSKWSPCQKTAQLRFLRLLKWTIKTNKNFKRKLAAPCCYAPEVLTKDRHTQSMGCRWRKDYWEGKFLWNHQAILLAVNESVPVVWLFSMHQLIFQDIRVETVNPILEMSLIPRRLVLEMGDNRLKNPGTWFSINHAHHLFQRTHVYACLACSMVGYVNNVYWARTDHLADSLQRCRRFSRIRRNDAAGTTLPTIYRLEPCRGCRSWLMLIYAKNSPLKWRTFGCSLSMLKATSISSIHRTTREFFPERQELKQNQNQIEFDK